MSNHTPADRVMSATTLSYFDDKENAAVTEGIERLVDKFMAQTKVCSKASVAELKRKFSAKHLPEQGIGIEAFLQEFDENVLQHAINTASPHYIGHMTALLPSFLRPLSKLKSALNQNMVKLETANSATFYENQALAMMHQLLYQNADEDYAKWIHDPAKTLGIITSGGTVANMTALQCARASSLSSVADVESEGLCQTLNMAGFEKSVVIVSQLGHYSIVKSLGLLGLGKQNLQSIPVDENQKIDLHALENALKQCRRDGIHVAAMVGIAGTTECGSFDPLVEMAELAKKHNVYFHVDAAWGGALLFSDKYRESLRGIEKADSVTIDGHKQLYLPMGLGMVLFKDPSTADMISNEANYIIRRDSLDLGRVALEGSRAANVFYLQAGIHLLGRQGYAQILESNIDTTKAMALAIEQAPEFELLTRPQSNIFLYRYIPERFRAKQGFSAFDNDEINRINITLQEKQRGEGRTFVSRTTLSASDSGEEKVGLRVVIANPLTTITHCMEVLEDQKQIAELID